MDYGYVYQYYYPPSESARSAITGGQPLSAAQPVTNATVSNRGQSLQFENRSQITLGNQSSAVGISVNISGSTETVSRNFS